MRRVQTKELSEQELAELKANALGILCDVRKTLLQRQPFVGSIAMNLDLVPIRDVRCNTACTDGSAIYFDIEFLSELKTEERMFVVAHEVWHNVMLHSMRLNGRDHKIFNFATDLEVNQLLKKDGFMICKDALMPQNMNVPPDLSAEEYYEILTKNKHMMNMPFDNQSSESSDSDRSQSESDDCGSSSKSMSGQFDKHVYKDEANKESSKETYDKYGKVGMDKDFRPSPTESAVEKIREAAVSAAQQIERSRGTLPDHIAKIVQSLVEPEVSWKEVLTSHVTRIMGERSNWNHPNRRFAWQGTYLPSHEGEKIKIAVGIDTSGSTDPDLPKFLSELNALVNVFGNYELHVIHCDTEVKHYELYDDSHPLDVLNDGITLHGGGGTRLEPIFKYIDEHQLDVDTICMFTDGCCETMSEDMAPAYPVLWLISNGGTSNNIHFGEVIEFKGDIS